MSSNRKQVYRWISFTKMLFYSSCTAFIHVFAQFITFLHRFYTICSYPHFTLHTYTAFSCSHFTFDAQHSYIMFLSSFIYEVTNFILLYFLSFNRSVYSSFSKCTKYTHRHLSPYSIHPDPVVLKMHYLSCFISRSAVFRQTDLAFCLILVNNSTFSQRNFLKYLGTI